MMCICVCVSSIVGSSIRQSCVAVENAQKWSHREKGCYPSSRIFQIFSDLCLVILGGWWSLWALSFFARHACSAPVHRRFDPGDRCHGAEGLPWCGGVYLVQGDGEQIRKVGCSEISGVTSRTTSKTPWNWMELVCFGHNISMKLSPQAANNADDDLGDVTDESPVPGIYNPQMDGKAQRRNIASWREWLTGHFSCNLGNLP